MKYAVTAATRGIEILANNHWAGVPHKFGADAKAGDIVESKGVYLHDVDANANPNGTVVVHGFINVAKLSEDQKPSSAQIAALPMIRWINEDGTFYAG